MKSLPKTGTGAFLSGGLSAAVLLMAAVFLIASGGAAGAASLTVNNQATRSVTVKAFSGSGAYCAPHVAKRVLPSATLAMTCPIREVCATFDSFLSPVGSTFVTIDVGGGAEDCVRTCRLSVNGANFVWTLDTRASDGTACDFRWNNITGDASSSLLVMCTDGSW